MKTRLAQLAPGMKKREILAQWPKRDRVHLVTKQPRPDLVEVRTTTGTLLGTYQRIEHLGWIELS